MQKLIEKARQQGSDDGKISNPRLCHILGMSPVTVRLIMRGEISKMRKSTLKRAYVRLGMINDEEYQQTMREWYKSRGEGKKQPQYILGFLFRNRRLELGMSIKEAAERVKVEPRTISRIEQGDTIPGHSSYCITSLIDLYEFDWEDAERIRRYICILLDMKLMVKKYNPTLNI